MRRVMIAECLHEVCSFNPVRTRISDFFVHSGRSLLQYHERVGTEVAGAVKVLSASSDVEIVPLLSARGSTSGGLMAAEDWTQLSQQFLAPLRQLGAVDGVYFCLHGALAAENEMDPEGFLLQETRRIVGDHVPIVASYDLHGILTDRMLEAVDATVAYHTYPHVDFYNTGERAAGLLLRIMNGQLRPVTARVFLPALVRGDELITRTGVFGEIVRRCQEIEQIPGGVAAGMFIGNPFTDVPALGSSSFVITDNDPQLATREALALADQFWQQRGKMQAELTSLEESVRIATDTEGTVILMDAADATSSGAPGDGNAILRQLMASHYPKRALIPIVDPRAVARAFDAGVGKTISVEVGGAFDVRVEPVPITAHVSLLSDGRFRSESFQQEWFSDRTAVLKAGRITLIATHRPVHLFDRSLFYAHGLDPRHFDVVVVKSPHCQPHMFASWCARLVQVDTPGATSANLRTLPYKNCLRPMYPLDDDVSFTPQAKIFTRPRQAITS